MKNVDLIDAYDALIQRALEIAEKLPEYVHEPNWARLSIKGDVARLSWPHDVMEYDSSTIDEESVEFPAALLLASEEEMKAWKKQMDAESKRQQAEWYAARKAEVVEEERRQLALLKAKYETPR